MFRLARVIPALRTPFVRSLSAAAATSAKYEMLLVEKRGAVGVITLNRPKALNALNSALIREINNGVLQQRPLELL